MKKKLMIRLIVFSAASIFFTSSYSQTSAPRIASLDTQANSSSEATLATGKDADEMALAGLKAVNTKMFNHFSRNYKNATDIRIRQVNNNTDIAFKMDSISNRVQYNKKGKWQYSIRTFEESKLPAHLRDQVETSYPGYRVFGFVTEVEVLNKSAVLVMIENKNSWKRIRIVDGDIDEYESYTKAAQ